jgi:excisionase family DNA binding protein
MQLARRPSVDWGWHLSPIAPAVLVKNEVKATLVRGVVLYNVLTTALSELAELPAVVRELRERVQLLEQELEHRRREDSDQLLTAEQAAELLRMSVAAVRQAARRGTLPVVRLGRRLRFRRADLLSAHR